MQDKLRLKTPHDKKNFSTLISDAEANAALKTEIQAAVKTSSKQLDDWMHMMKHKDGSTDGSKVLFDFYEDMRRAQKKKVAVSEDGPSASAAPAPRIPSAKPAPPVAAAQGGHADELLCLQVQLRQAVEDEDAAQEAYIGRNKLLESAIAEYRKEAQELEQLYEWQEREVGVHHGAVVRGREILELLLHHEAHGRRHGARIRVRGGWDARPQSLLDRDAGGGELLPAGVEQERRRVDQLLAALGSQHRDAHGRDARVGDALRAEVRHREVAQLGTGHRGLGARTAV